MIWIGVIEDSPLDYIVKTHEYIIRVVNYRLFLPNEY